MVGEFLGCHADEGQEHAVSEPGGDEKQRHTGADETKCQAGRENRHGEQFHQRADQLEDQVEGQGEQADLAVAGVEDHRSVRPQGLGKAP